MERADIRKLDDQSGEIMLEASFIMVSVLILLLSLLSINFMFYQEALMNSVASEIASDISKTYKFKELDISKDSLDLSTDLAKTNRFRLNLGKSGAVSKQSARADKYADNRIRLATLGLNPGDVTATCEVENTGIGRAYIKVTVEQETDFFLSGVLKYAGIAEERNMFKATAHAECVDLSAYTSSVNFTYYVSQKLTPLSAIANLYDSVKTLIQKITN